MSTVHADTQAGLDTDDEMIIRHGGAAILYHELGHYLDDALPNEWYSKKSYGSFCIRNIKLTHTAEV